MPGKSVVKVLWAITAVLALIGIAVGIRRMFNLSPTAAPPRFPVAADLDRGFITHAQLTRVHVIPGLLFMVLGPLQFSSRIRGRHLRFHRYSGRVFVGAGFVVGITALVMSPMMAIGGLNETIATCVFALFFLFALTKGFIHVRRRQVARHREWMIRAFAIGLAIATIRPIMGVFFATSRFTHLTPHDFFGTAFWLGFTLHLIAAEAWIHYTAPSTFAPGGVSQATSSR